LDAKQFERGLVCTPGTLPVVSAALVKVSKTAYFKESVLTKAKFHITIGHSTVMGSGIFFGQDLEQKEAQNDVCEFDYTKDYVYQDELLLSNNRVSVADTKDVKPESTSRQQYVLLEFETPISCAQNFLVIGSKFDTDIHSNTCRIAFHVRVVEPMIKHNYTEVVLPKLKVFKIKRKEGLVDHKVDDYTLVCRGLFKKETDMRTFVGLKVSLSLGDKGFIESGFGQSGKFKVRIPSGLGEECRKILNQRDVKKTKNKAKAFSDQNLDESSASTELTSPIKVYLEFKRYIFDPLKQMIQ